MANCFDCWWANYDASEDKHITYTEPDYTTAAAFGESTPEIAVIRTCAKGASYFKSFGRQTHDCPKFSSFAKSDAKRQAKQARIKRTLALRTSRSKIEESSNPLVLIERMSEGHDGAFTLLVDMLGVNHEVFSSVVWRLYDMNIRGKQIAAAERYMRSQGSTLAALTKADTTKLARYVNKHNPIPDEGVVAKDAATHWG